MKILWMSGGTMGVGKTAVSRHLDKDFADAVCTASHWRQMNRRCTADWRNLRCE